MTSSRRTLAVGGAAILLCAIGLAHTPGSLAQEPEGNYGVGISDVFLPKYLAFRAQQLKSATPNVMRIRLGYVKGLSRSFTGTAGEIAVNLDSGAVDVSLSGLTPSQTYSVWLLDRTENEALVPDKVFGLATFVAAGSSTLLKSAAPLSLPAGFTIDRAVVVTGAVSSGPAQASGSVNVFQKIFFRRLSLLNASAAKVSFEETTAVPARSALVPDLGAETDAADPSTGATADAPTLGFAMPPSSPELEAAAAAGSRSVRLDRLISKGARLFFEETFRGNGRTCGTCHPANNNFMIDKDFIATLPANDSLFVAEFIPALARLERPRLMRSFGLILENLDGLDDPANKFVMRGVPHTLGLQVSLQRDTGLVPAAPAEMTGWSGDGAPGTGSLRDFAIGAVTQHFTKRLERVGNRDFKLPREHQLDAMEAFQLSLGRSAEFNLAGIAFTNANVNTGKSLFINGGGDPNFAGTCNFCHANGGANALTPANENRNFITNVEGATHPARSILNFPIDGGFGQAANPDGSFGNRTFNTASVVEAADTPPFFHNNIVNTLEDVVRFYAGPEFDQVAFPGAGFRFNETQVNQIADFMRGLNTLQNIQVARRELDEILANRNNPRAEQDQRLQTAYEETQDAIEVLSEEGLFPAAKTQLVAARNLISQAQLSGDPGQRRTLIQQAINKLNQARNAVAIIS